MKKTLQNKGCLFMLKYVKKRNNSCTIEKKAVPLYRERYK